MSNLTSILASTFFPETASLNNSQTLIASGNIFNSGGFTEASADQQKMLKAFGNYRTGFYERDGSGNIIQDAKAFFGRLDSVTPSQVEALYRDNVGLVFFPEAQVSRINQNLLNYDLFTPVFSASGFVRGAMILKKSGKVLYVLSSDLGKLILISADSTSPNKNPLPLIGQKTPVVSKPEANLQTTTVKPGQKSSTAVKTEVPLLGDTVLSSQEILASTIPAAAANKPGAPAGSMASAPTTPVFKLSEKFDPAANFFRIIYADAGSNIKSFVFTFLPARETKIGNWNVPEARTGMPIQTKMRHKMQVVPGAGPIVQTIGINGTTVTLVGALLGNEVIAEDFATGGPNSRPVYASSNKVQGTNTYAEGAYPGALPRGAYDKAIELQRRLVYPGRLVTIEIKPSSTQATFQMKADGSTNKIGDFIRMTGVITAIRLQHAHSDRCYYALDLFVTEYPEAPAAKPNTEQVLKAANSKYLGPTIDGRPAAIVRAEDDLEELKKSKTLSGVKIDGRPAEIVRAEDKLAEIKKKFDVTIDGRPAFLVREEADKQKKDYAKIKAKLTAAQKAQLKKILDAAPKDKRALLEKNYLEKIGLRASLDTRLGIDEGVDYAEELANANPEAASESSAIAADYLAATFTNQAPIGLSIASISQQLTNNIQGSATVDNVLSAISNATAGTLRPAQQKAALEQIAARPDLDPTQLSYLTNAISRYNI